MELQDIEQHMGIHTSVCENVSRLLKCMVTAARVGLGSHSCALKVKKFSNLVSLKQSNNYLTIFFFVLKRLPNVHIVKHQSYGISFQRI